MGALVVTISATYGAGGSVLAPALAGRLGVRFLDRMVSSDAATAAAASDEGLSDAEEAATPGSRLFLYLSRAAGVTAMAPPESIIDHNDGIRERAEADVTDLCGAGGVLLGRAGAVVLGRRPATFHVRLDGPVERRVARAAAIEGVDPAEARRRLADTDRARANYVRRLYRVDPADPALYHVVLDTTVLSTDGALDVLERAVAAFAEATAPRLP